jgi:hypothetical protein
MDCKRCEFCVIHDDPREADFRCEYDPNDILYLRFNSQFLDCPKGKIISESSKELPKRAVPEKPRVSEMPLPENICSVCAHRMDVHGEIANSNEEAETYCELFNITTHRRYCKSFMDDRDLEPIDPFNPGSLQDEIEGIQSKPVFKGIINPDDIDNPELKAQAEELKKLAEDLQNKIAQEKRAKQVENFLNERSKELISYVEQWQSSGDLNGLSMIDIDYYAKKRKVPDMLLTGYIIGLNSKKFRSVNSQ